MFYRVSASISFKSLDEARDYYHDCEKALPKGNTINLAEINEERGYIALQECHHDIDPRGECDLVKEQWGPD